MGEKHMRKITMNVEDCEPGMQIAETVFNEYGAIIVSEGTLLDNHILRKLDNLGILKIKISDQSENEIISNSAEAFKAQYNENIEVFKDVLHDISTGKNIDLKKVNNVSDSVFVWINENRDIVSCIGQIRDVDEYTYTHSMNVSLLCMLLGKWMKMDAAKIKMMVQAGLLHDIGKSRIPPEILNKPGTLSNEEFEEIKKHPVYGYRILEKMPEISKEICMGVLMHHEREDGSGYPTGARGEQINEIAKIIAVADIYDAMTSNRVYRERESPFEVFEKMENKTFGLLDPKVINAFLNNIASYYIGDIVKLNTGEIGEIVYINPRHVSQPLVKVGNKYLDLTLERGVRINELI